MARMNQTPVDKNSREYQTQQRNNGRNTIMLILVFTVINLVLLLAEADRYFLFSASVPYYLTLFGVVFDAGQAWGSFTVTALVISVVILAAYLLCWIFSKKRAGWLVAALVLFIVDTVALLLLSLSMDLLADNILDFVIHGIVVWELIAALRADKKLKAMPKEMPEGYAGTTPELD